jgi:hypothetical protein
LLGLLQQRGEHARVLRLFDQLAGLVGQHPSAGQVAPIVTHRREQQQPVGAVQAHAVDLEQFQRPLQLHLGLGQLPLAGQRPSQRQVDDPRQRLEVDPFCFGSCHRTMGQRGGVGVVLVGGD